MDYYLCVGWSDYECKVGGRRASMVKIDSSQGPFGYHMWVCV